MKKLLLTLVSSFAFTFPALANPGCCGDCTQVQNDNCCEDCDN